MKSKFKIENDKKNGKHIIKVMGSIDASIAEELVDFLANELNGNIVFLLDFKDVWRIDETALKILAHALKKPELKRRNIQFSGLTTREAKLLSIEGVEITRTGNCFNILKEERRSHNNRAVV
jgi:anti-anti-sigma regulatory factor